MLKNMLLLIHFLLCFLKMMFTNFPDRISIFNPSFFFFLLLLDPGFGRRQESDGPHVLSARPQLPGRRHPREGQEEEGGREEEEETRQLRQRR